MSLLFESLENRLLLAGNVLDDTGLPGSDAEIAAVTAGAASAASGAVLLEVEDQPQFSGQAEGEDAPDLVAFAKALADAGVVYYGAGWCPFCIQQKELFEDGGHFLPFVEVTNPDRTLNQVGIDNNINQFPTWVMPDGDRLTGLLSLQELSDESGVAIPQGSAPSFAPLENVTVFGGAPLHVALDGYDPNGTEITYTVTSSNPSLVTPELREGRSLRLDTSFGDIVIGTFEDQVPRVTEALFQLVEDDVWDNTIFHRVINGFVIQGGDPTGTGFGDSSLPRFDDQFHVDGQHTSANLASIAKAGDDSASSQFFLTEGTPLPRHLDFNHSVWGLIVEGAENREAISNVATGANDRPTIDVTLNEATVFEDPENAVLTLKAPEGATGSAMITVTATDSEGLTATQTFQVTVTPDTANGRPFLRDIDDVTTAPGTPVTIELTAVDVEGNPIRFDAFDASNVSISLPGSPVTPAEQEATATLTITPDAGFVGTQQITLFVHDPSDTINAAQTTASQIAGFADVQTITITVAQGAPTGLDLVADSDTGSDDEDNVTSDATPQITVDGVADGALVQIFSGTTQVAEGTASGSSITLTTDTLTDGVHTLTATQTINAEESSASPPLEITIDTQVGNFTSTPALTGDLGVEYSYDAEVDEEGEPAFSYDLLEAPDGASIDPATGEIRWTPVASQLGAQSFTVVATDLAGNTREQAFDVEVDGDLFAQFHFEIVDGSGNALSQVEVGEEFTLRVSVEDPRRFPTGVFAAYLDVMFEQGLVEVISDLEFGDTYSVARSGNPTVPGEIDEAGAASGSLTPLEDGTFLLFTVDLRANIAGTETIFGDPADEPISHDILVFGDNDPVSTALVDYGSITLDIGLGFGANGDIFNFDEDSSENELDVLDNDESDGTLTITDVGTPSEGGTVTINTAGDRLIYTPAPDFNGSETFSYTVSDSAGGGTDTATVVIQVQPVNDPPTADDDEISVEAGSTNTLIDVLGNDDIAPDVGETLRVIAVGTTQNGGTARIGAGGAHVRYDAPDDFSGTDTFTYTVSDGNGGTATATVNVTVNDNAGGDPLAVNDSFTVDEDTANNEFDVLANDNPDGDPGDTLRIVSAQGFSDGGTVSIINSGTTLRYTPAADFSGVETFTYVVEDGDGQTDEAIVTVTVENVNDAPTAEDDELFASSGQADQTLDVLANDTDPDDGDTLEIVSVSQGSEGGSLSIAADGTSVRYTPASGFLGEENFTYTIEDAAGETSQATATVTVRDFVPSSLSGYVYLDLDNDGVKDENERPVIGVTITLTGTDEDGNDVELSQRTGLDGSYSFTDLVPGQYTITQVQPELLRDGQETAGSQGGDTATNDAISVELAEDVQGTGNNFGERGRAAESIGLMDLLASTHNETVVAAFNGESGADWYAPDPQWVQVVLSDLSRDEQSGVIELRASDGNGGEQTALVTPNDAARLQLFAAAAGSQLSLARLVGSPEAFNLSAPGGSDGGSENDSSPADGSDGSDDSSSDDSGGDDTSDDGSGDDGSGDDNGAGGEGEAAAAFFRTRFASDSESLLEPADLPGVGGAEGESGAAALVGDPVLFPPQSSQSDSPSARSVDALMADWSEPDGDEPAGDLLLDLEAESP